MNWVTKAMITGISSFTATNLDDIVILTFYFSQVNPNLRIRHIVFGQYLGFSALVVASLIGFFGGLMISKTWIGLLGFVPIFIGIKQLIRENNDPDNPQILSSEINRFPLSRLFSPQIYSVAAVTFANGGDNIGIYVPLFANSKLAELVIILSVFMVMIGIWCIIGYQLVRYPLIKRAFNQFGGRIVPLILISLGIFILVDSQTYQLLPWF